MTTELMWFRRDLRLADNRALAEGAHADHLLTVFVLDPHLLTHQRMSPARLRYLGHALQDLGDRLAQAGGRLLVCQGDPRVVLPDLAQTHDIRTVHAAADHTPFAVARDEEVRSRLQDVDATLVLHDGVAIVPPGTVRTGSDTVYKVFTPFHRRWRDVANGDALDAPDTVPNPPEDLPDGVDVGAVEPLQVTGPEQPWPQGGETAARARMQAWLQDGVEEYDDNRNALAADMTSKLSPDLHFGCLSARELWGLLDRRRNGHKTYATELAWRDFYLHVMAEWPHAARSAFREEYADLSWRQDDDGFQAWADGKTGYPVVDAAMRQLATTGWMHNRARMIVASFLCKDLLIDWRRGEAHFMAHLVDGDPASNNGGWQWAAGTGTDAQPFHRIFNPITQGERFDPEGDYIRRFVPELAPLPTKLIHRPWTLTEGQQAEHGVTIGTDYPAPIVDHAEARSRALDWWEQT